MEARGQPVRIVHAISGRLRLRFEGDGLLVDGDGLSKSLAALQMVSGVLSAELKPSARSAIVRYDPAIMSEQAVLAELAGCGIDVAVDEDAAPMPTAESGKSASKSRPTAPSAAQATEAGAPKPEGRSALMEALIGPPPKLDWRFAESIGLSIVSLLAARRVGLALGGGTTLPAYFAIWFALRRLTGAGRRRSASG
jgi:hypothetical protein